VAMTVRLNIRASTWRLDARDLDACAGNAAILLFIRSLSVFGAADCSPAESKKTSLFVAQSECAMPADGLPDR
jgi:hypothetical protein